MKLKTALNHVENIENNVAYSENDKTCCKILQSILVFMTIQHFLI